MSLNIINGKIKAHLKTARAASDDDTATVKRKAELTMARHEALETATKAVIDSSGGSLEMSAFVQCMSTCRSKDASPPAFIPIFVESVVSRWTRRLVSRLSEHAQWTSADALALQATLRGAVHQRLCHRSHVAAVDGNMNPNSLCEYVRCIRFVWVQGRGRPTPAALQSLQKISGCSSDCCALICDYASVEASNPDCMALSRLLSMIQSCLRSGFVSSGIHTSVAEECISSIHVDTAAASALEAAEMVLDSTWDFLRGNVEDVPSVDLPGLAGSHVPTIQAPVKLLSRGGARVVINFLSSAVLLSKHAYGDVPALTMSSDEPEVKELPDNIRSCVGYMQSGAHFGSHTSCDADWWVAYCELLQQLAEETCTLLGVEPPSSVDTTSPAPEPRFSLSSLCASKLKYEGSSIKKVAEASRLFDNVALALKRGSDTAKLTVGTAGDAIVIGKLFSDIELIATNERLEVRFFPREKLVTFKTEANGESLLTLLVNYMCEMSLPRRKRDQSKLLPHNKSHSLEDGRKKAKASVQ